MEDLLGRLEAESFARSCVQLSSDPIASIMIEVNRRLYMDESTGAKVATFAATKVLVARLVLAAVGRFPEP